MKLGGVTLALTGQMWHEDVHIIADFMYYTTLLSL